MRKILILSLLLLVAALPVAAQSLTGTVAGVVKDDQGGVLPGVTVTLIGKTGNRATTTDAEGAFRFAAVNPGAYSLTTELSGFRAKRQDNVDVGIGKMAEINFTLGVGGVTETVDVIGESPVVDVTSSSTDNTLSQDMLFNMPIRVDNAASELLNFLPGINDGSAFGGNQDYGNALLVDGVDTRDPDAGSAWTFFSFNIIDEVQVGGLGANAEYGAYTGAIVNTLTKSGGNRYAGLFDAYYTTADLFGDNVSDEVKAGNASLADPAVLNKKLDLNAQLSGPIIKDKLFFFVNAQRFEIDEDPSGPLTKRTEVSPRFNGKLTWQPGPNDSLSANFQYDNYNVTGRRPTLIGLLTTDELTYQQDSPEAIWGLQWRHLFGTKTFIEAKYTGWWGYYYLDPTVPGVPLSFDSTAGLYSGSAGQYGYYDRTRNQLNASISHYAEAFGKHDLKFGVEIERSKVRNRGGYTPAIYYYDYTEYYPKGEYLAFDYSYDTSVKTERESLYAQDAWKPTERLTINAGVRMDFMRGRSEVLDKTVYSATGLAPRLGFAFDLTGNGKTVLKGFYGQYYEGIYADAYYSAVPGVEDFVTYAFDPGGEKCGPAGKCFTEDDRSPNTISRIDPDIKHPRVDEITLGFERELVKNVRLSVTGIWREDKNVQGSVYPDARWTLGSVTTSTAGNDPALQGTTVPVYQWANRSASENNNYITNVDGFRYLDPNGQVLGTASGERTYKAAMFVLDRRFSDRWQGRISYVYSKSEGILNNTGSNTYGKSSFYETPTNALVNTFGPLTNDRPHELKIFGSWQIPKAEVMLSGYYRYLSGRTYTPFQRFGASAINFPLSSGRQPFLEARGLRRLDSESYLDLRVEKIFKIGAGASRISVYGDFQNILNQGTVISKNARWPNVAIAGVDDPIEFEGPLSIIEPRRVLLGARWTF
ncbi:MAG TPA: TonB-dependent receptor [Vicinamibacteria bacterium]|nr:TonB-dependent receptor [Vicinamibacteria bacterium]